jgi:hypothetical protein
MRNLPLAVDRRPAALVHVGCSPVDLDATVANPVGLNRGRPGANDTLSWLHLALRGLCLALCALYLALRGLGALDRLGAIGAGRGALRPLSPLGTLALLLPLSTVLAGLGPLRTHFARIVAITAAGALRQCGARKRKGGCCRQNGKKDLTHNIPQSLP